VFDFAFEAVDGEVQAAEAAVSSGFLNAVDGQFLGRIAGVALTPSPSPIRWTRVAATSPQPSPSEGRGRLQVGASCGEADFGEAEEDEARTGAEYSWT